MKILYINTVYGNGSTGKIVRDLCMSAKKSGHDVLAFDRYSTSKFETNVEPMSTWLDCHIHNRISTITGLQGCFSFLRTRKALEKIKVFSPDIIHIHNIHGSYVNLPTLFAYIKKKGIPVVWTLHDCWSFTGGCPHFLKYSCDKWKIGCGNCPHNERNKKNLIDTSAYMWRKKQKWFSSVQKMTLICPSKWIASFLSSSYLKAYPYNIIPNGIDLTVFKHMKSDLKDKYGFQNIKIILGVSYKWNKSKGLDVFLELAKRLPTSKYRILLVGDLEDKQIMTENIVGLSFTDDQNELAKIYSAADVFVNPTREDNYPTVNMEALACGTPVVTFRTGGSPEMLDDTCGSVVECDDVDALEQEIVRICVEKPYSKEACLKKAKEFDKNERFKEYLNLYRSIYDGSSKNTI